MQSKGCGQNLDYFHAISNFPQMIAKFSKLNLGTAGDEDSDTESENNKDQEYADFYGESLWLGQENIDIKPSDQLIEPSADISDNSTSHHFTMKEVGLFNSSILRVNPTDNTIHVNTVAVEKAPIMKFFVGSLPTECIMDTGAESNVISEIRAKYLNLTILAWESKKVALLNYYLMSLLH